MIENEIDNRGSKSSIKRYLMLVKAQRVDGSWHPFYKKGCLRCTLKGFEINYLTMVLSRQIDQRRAYFTDTVKIRSSDQSDLLSSNISPNSFFWTGFTDAEGSLIISITKSPTNRLGWSIQPYFKISLHEKDLSILQKFKSYFKDAGKIEISGKGRNSYSYVISSRAEIKAVVLPHFDKYSLLTHKRADYELFKRAIHVMDSYKHLTEEGLQEIINNKASLNLGLSDRLKVAFPNTTPVPRPLFDNLEVLHPQWLAGFCSGEGCFFVSISKSSTKLGYSVKIRFILSQHLKDEQLIKGLVEYFGKLR